MKQISNRLFIAPQLTDADLSAAKAKGITTIINNRPDGEEATQPTASDNRRAAEAEGLSYVHIPVVPGQVNEGQVRAFQNALDHADGSVLAHCRTGTRSATLYAIGEVLDGRMSKDEIGAFGKRLDLDLSGARNWLDANGY